MVILDPLGWWSLVLGKSSDWSPGQGRRPRGEGGRPAPGPVRLPVRSHGFWSLLDDKIAWHINISKSTQRVGLSSVFPDNPL